MITAIDQLTQWALSTFSTEFGDPLNNLLMIHWLYYKLNLKVYFCYIIASENITRFLRIQ